MFVYLALRIKNILQNRHAVHRATANPANFVFSLFQEKTVALTTYAICGFSSLGTFAIFVGVWTVISKGKVSNLSSMVVRSYFNTNIACFMTACVAGELASNLSSFSILIVPSIQRTTQLRLVLSFSGIFYDEDVLLSLYNTPSPTFSIATLMNIVPGYEVIVQLLPDW